MTTRPALTSAQCLDRSTQQWVRLTGRRVELAAQPWLQGPVGDLDTVADTWLAREAERLDASVGTGGGLVDDLSRLDGPDFRASRLAAPVRDFYERTSDWRLDAWVGWSPWAWPGGWLVSSVFARRLQQLALPVHPLDVAHGMTSTVRPLHVDGRQVGAMWLRRLRATGDVLFSGLYGVVALAAPSRPAVRVVFPLPDGRLVVLLEVADAPGGGLLLQSGPGGWGQAGTYLVVEAGGRAWARRVPLHEVFHVHVDTEGVLRTDHRLALGPSPVLRLHYRMTDRMTDRMTELPR